MARQGSDHPNRNLVAGGSALWTRIRSCVIVWGRNDQELVHRKNAANLALLTRRTSRSNLRCSQFGTCRPPNENDTLLERHECVPQRDERQSTVNQRGRHSLGQGNALAAPLENGARRTIAPFRQLAPHLSPASATPRTTLAVGLAESNPLPSGCHLNERGLLGETACQ